MGGAVALATEDAIRRGLFLATECPRCFCMPPETDHKDRPAKENKRKNLRLDVLAQPGLGRVRVLGHVAASAAACGDDGRLQGGCLQVLGLERAILAAIVDITGAATARRLQVRHDVFEGCRGGETRFGLEELKIATDCL